MSQSKGSREEEERICITGCEAHNAVVGDLEHNLGVHVAIFHHIASLLRVKKARLRSRRVKGE